MADKIKVIFHRVYVKHDNDWIGDGEFYFIVSVDGKQVGNPKQIFDAVEGTYIVFPQPQWSAEVDVTGKAQMAVRFKGKEQDLLWDDDLGPEVGGTIKPPWEQRFYQNETDDYRLEWSIELAGGGGDRR